MYPSKFDIYNLKTVAEIRAGINTRNMAVSFDGRYAMVANYLPHNLVLLDTENLTPIKVIPVEGRVSAVYTAPPRNSFVAALKDSMTAEWKSVLAVQEELCKREYQSASDKAY